MTDLFDDQDPIAHIRHLPIPEQMKYAFARYVWPRRNQVSPNKSPSGAKETWGQMFKRNYGQELNDYVEFCKKNYRP